MPMGPGHEGPGPLILAARTFPFWPAPAGAPLAAGVLDVLPALGALVAALDLHALGLVNRRGALEGHLRSAVPPTRYSRHT